MQHSYRNHFKEISVCSVEQDFDRLRWSRKLSSIPRFYGQRYWEKETALETRRRNLAKFGLENVAEHSWHLCDAVLVIAPRFAPLNVDRAVSLATVHDILEIETGDFDPVGDGAGDDTHAFSLTSKARKDISERKALNELRARFADCTPYQFDLIAEYLDLQSEEACFVKALDKIQVLILIEEYKSEEGVESSHLQFANRYCRDQVQKYFPALTGHLNFMLERIESLPKKQGLRKSA